MCPGSLMYWKVSRAIHSLKLDITSPDMARSIIFEIPIVPALDCRQTHSATSTPSNGMPNLTLTSCSVTGASVDDVQCDLLFRTPEIYSRPLPLHTHCTALPIEPDQPSHVHYWYIHYCVIYCTKCLLPIAMHQNNFSRTSASVFAFMELRLNLSTNR